MLEFILPSTIKIMESYQMSKLLSIVFAVSLSTAALQSQAASVQATDTFNGHTYLLLTTDTWANSQAAALTIGGNLITVNDAAENFWLINTAFNGFGLTSSLWIGYMRDQNTNNFVWVDGDSSGYTNWSAGEPNDFAGNEDFVHTYTSGAWNDLADGSSFSGNKFGVVEITTTTATPLPAAAPLMLSALGLFGLARRNRKSA